VHKHGFARQFMQHLGSHGFHTGALAGGENDNIEFQNEGDPESG